MSSNWGDRTSEKKKQNRYVVRYNGKAFSKCQNHNAK